MSPSIWFASVCSDLVIPLIQTLATRNGIEISLVVVDIVDIKVMRLHGHIPTYVPTCLRTGHGVFYGKVENLMYDMMTL